MAPGAVANNSTLIDDNGFTRIIHSLITATTIARSLRFFVIVLVSRLRKMRRERGEVSVRESAVEITDLVVRRARVRRGMDA